MCFVYQPIASERFERTDDVLRGLVWYGYIFQAVQILLFPKRSTTVSCTTLLEQDLCASGAAWTATSRGAGCGETNLFECDSDVNNWNGLEKKTGWLNAPPHVYS